MQDVLSEMLNGVPLPNMVPVRLRQAEQGLPTVQIPEAIEQILSAERFAKAVRPNMRVAITAGSRGIANIALIIKTIAQCVKNRGAEPFIIPAMGSHGGATAEGQTEVLRHYGISEEACGCPVLSSMDVKTVAHYQDMPLMVDKAAAEADGIIVVGRVKPHTNFVGAYESGLLKMMAIGMGNHLGAQAAHAMGIENFPMLLPAWGKLLLASLPVLFGIAIIDNAVHETAHIEGVLPQDFLEREPELLHEARRLMPHLYFTDYDALIVGRIGKDISGSGMDPHVTGSFNTEFMRKCSGVFRARNIAVLDLSDASEHNAYGIGDADVTTNRLWQKTNLSVGYPNAVISNCLSSAKIPIIMQNDKQAIQVSLKCCVGIRPAEAKVIYIKDTLHVKDIYISEALLPQAASLHEVSILGAPRAFHFDAQGNLRNENIIIQNSEIR